MTPFSNHATPPADYSMLSYLPSVLAASAVVTARSLLGITPCWAPGLLSASGLAEVDLMECVQRLWGVAGKGHESPANRHEMAAVIFAPPPAVPLVWDQCV